MVDASPAAAETPSPRALVPGICVSQFWHISWTIDIFLYKLGFVTSCQVPALRSPQLSAQKEESKANLPWSLSMLNQPETNPIAKKINVPVTFKG